MIAQLAMLLGFLLVLTGSVHADDLPAPDPAAPVDLAADQLDFEQESGRYHAQGNVQLEQGSLKFRSDELWWNQQTGEVEAAGDVLFTGPGERLSGERMSYSLTQGTGVLEEGEAYWPAKSLHISGERLERMGPNRFQIINGRFSVCDGERPAWSVGSKVSDVRIGRYMTAKHALIYIKDVPVFYTPYFMVSVKTERESGFLMPRIGFSDRRGTEVSAAWYQVLGRNMDATIYLDHLSKLGTGTGLEYRYIFGQRQRGNFKVYTVIARDGVNRWALDWQHIGQLRKGLRLVVDAEYVNERDYFSDYGEVSGEYNKQKVISSVFLNQTWEKASLTGQAKYIKDLEREDPLPWQAAPHVDFSVAPWRLSRLPLYLGVQSAFTSFTREKGATGNRLTARPTIGMHAYLFKGLEFDSEYGYRYNRYAQVSDAMGDSSGSDDYRARLASRISRVFGTGDRSWLHSIEPEVVYNYAGRNIAGDLPDFDQFDRTEPLNELGYVLTNRLTGKWRDAEGGETQRELVWLQFSQEYNLRKRDTDEFPFSDLRSQLTVRPTSQSSVTFDSLYDVERGRMPDFSINGNLNDGRGNGMTVTYSKRRPATGFDKVDNVNFRLDTSLLKPLYLGYEQRYDFLESNRLEQVLDLDYRQQCWGLKVTLREQEIERSVMLTLTLGGIGEVGQFGTSLADR